jgi:hypothetical protein
MLSTGVLLSMPRKIPRSVVLWLIVALCAIATGVPVRAQPVGAAKTLQRVTDPVIVSGKDLPQLIGKDIAHIRVFAFRNGKAVAIPFQIDQRDSSGQWVWDVVYRKRFAFIDEEIAVPRKWEPATSGRGTSDDEDPVGTALLDANDVLVFMAEDVGDYSEAPRTGIDAPLILSLEVSDSLNGTRGWVYVAYYPASPPPLSKIRYMKYNAEQKTVQSPIYSFHFSDQHMALIHNLQVNKVTIVDRVKIEGEVTLSMPIPGQKLRFDEDDIQGHTEGYIAGPVRIVKRNIARLSLAGGLLNAPEVTCDNFYYPHHAEIPVCLSTGFPVKQIQMTLTTDYRNPPFDRLYMGRARQLDATPGVTPSLQARLRRLGTEWIVLDGDQASLINLVVVPDSVEGRARAQPCLCSDKEKPVHTHIVPGTRTETGFLITSSADCPKGEHILYGHYLISAQPYEPGDEYAAFGMQHNKLTTRVSPVWPAH